MVTFAKFFHACIKPFIKNQQNAVCTLLLGSYGFISASQSSNLTAGRTTPSGPIQDNIARLYRDQSNELWIRIESILGSNTQAAARAARYLLANSESDSLSDREVLVKAFANGIAASKSQLLSKDEKVYLSTLWEGHNDPDDAILPEIPEFSYDTEDPLDVGLWDSLLDDEDVNRDDNNSIASIDWDDFFTDSGAEEQSLYNQQLIHISELLDLFTPLLEVALDDLINYVTLNENDHELLNYWQILFSITNRKLNTAAEQLSIILAAFADGKCHPTYSTADSQSNRLRETNLLLNKCQYVLKNIYSNCTYSFLLLSGENVDHRLDQLTDLELDKILGLEPHFGLLDSISHISISVDLFQHTVFLLLKKWATLD